MVPLRGSELPELTLVFGPPIPSWGVEQGFDDDFTGAAGGGTVDVTVVLVLFFFFFNHGQLYIYIL